MMDNHTPGYPVSPVRHRQVVLRDEVLHPRLETNRTVTVPAVLRKCEESGRVENFRRAARPGSGGYTGTMPFEDTDVYKAVEGASGCLGGGGTSDDAPLEALVEVIAAAQEPDGYLYTARTIRPPADLPFMGPTRWSSLAMSHELYNCGHLYEAAGAHYEATGRRELLDVALRNADLVCRTFGPAARHDTCGHPIVEMGLARLYRVSGDRRYLAQARFFLEQRGRHEGRIRHDFAGDPGYAQDHLPLRAQREVVGHAVRAMYLYCGMADVAAMWPEPAYTAVLETLWRDLTGSKIYLTGGIGARHQGESFGAPFELPNDTAYAETCASIGSVMWNQRMFLLTGEARHIDVLEQTLYNRVLSGVSLGGDEFFYANPLASDGVFGFNQGHPNRQPWFEVSCCPTSLCRFLPTVPGYFYAVRGSSLYMNLFAAGSADVSVSGVGFHLEQATRYPWDGAVALTVDPESPTRARLHVRIPGWTSGHILGSSLYAVERRPEGSPRLVLNGEDVALGVEMGYAVIDRVWRQGDRVELYLPMPVLRVQCDPRVVENRGRVALQRGPVVYCIEDRDVEGRLESIRAGEPGRIVSFWAPELLGGIVALRGPGYSAIPYAVWANRGAGPMAVWLND
jgi:DUF1680 family protein